MTSRRAVAPIIATLLLVAIAVVGGSIIFVFSQGFFSSAQISGAPQIESLELLGYDMTDGDVLIMHDGFCTSGGIIDDIDDPCTLAADFDGTAGDGLVTGDRFALYVQNQSVSDVTIVEILLAGAEYDYVELAPITGDQVAPFTLGGGDADLDDGEYYIVTRGDILAGESAFLKSTPQATLSPGEDVTLLFAIDDNVPIGRDVQLKLTTANGAVFVTTLIAGQQSG